MDSATGGVRARATLTLRIIRHSIWNAVGGATGRAAPRTSPCRRPLSSMFSYSLASVTIWNSGIGPGPIGFQLESSKCFKKAMHLFIESHTFMHNTDDVIWKKGTKNNTVNINIYLIAAATRIFKKEVLLGSSMNFRHQSQPLAGRNIPGRIDETATAAATSRQTYVPALQQHSHNKRILTLGKSCQFSKISTATATIAQIIRISSVCTTQIFTTPKRQHK